MELLRKSLEFLYIDRKCCFSLGMGHGWPTQQQDARLPLGERVLAKLHVDKRELSYSVHGTSFHRADPCSLILISRDLQGA